MFKGIFGLEILRCQTTFAGAAKLSIKVCPPPILHFHHPILQWIKGKQNPVIPVPDIDMMIGIKRR